MATSSTLPRPPRTELVGDPYDPRANLDSFSFDRWAAQLLANPLVRSPEGRRLLTRLDPLAFALIYLDGHLREQGVGPISIGDQHLDWYRQARSWVRPVRAPREWRRAFVAPRQSGKTTTWYLIVPAWAAAHGHVQFAAAFGPNWTAASEHLATFRRELRENDLLRADFPELCEPAKDGRDTQDMYQAASGFVFASKGLDQGVQGLKVRNLRPDLLLIDDIEKPGKNHSEAVVQSRLATVVNQVFPMNSRARVLMIGTIASPGSVMDQLVRAARGEAAEPWVAAQQIEAHEHKAIYTRDDGTERSVWPQAYPWDTDIALNRHERSWKLQYLNEATAIEGALWSARDFRYGTLTSATTTVLSIDPAVSSKRTSDETGIAVVSYSLAEGKLLVREARGVRLAPGEPLRTEVLRTIGRWSALGVPIQHVLVEADQGGDTWDTVLHDLPTGPPKKVHAKKLGSKVKRAEYALQRYQQGMVLHAQELNPRGEYVTALPRAEEQMLAFTGREGNPDDLVDAVGQAINALVPPVLEVKRRVGARVMR